MTTTNKDFKVKNGLRVSGNAVFGSEIVLGSTPIAFDNTTKRLKILIDNEWIQIANLEDADVLTFEDIGVAIDYDGAATYIIQGNGVTPSSLSKFVDGGSPDTTTVRYIFDAGTIQ
jgi:hypothetical protein